MAFITYYSKWNWEEGHFVSVNSYPHHHQTPSQHPGPPSQPPNPTQESPEFGIGIFGIRSDFRTIYFLFIISVLFCKNLKKKFFSVDFVGRLLLLHPGNPCRSSSVSAGLRKRSKCRKQQQQQQQFGEKKQKYFLKIDFIRLHFIENFPSQRLDFLGNPYFKLLVLFVRIL